MARPDSVARTAKAATEAESKPPHYRPPEIPDELKSETLGALIRSRLVGRPVDGSRSGAADAAKVIWVDGGDEVLIHLDATRVEILDRTLLVSVDMETDQTGRQPLVCVFALGDTEDPAGLFAVTDEFPRGNGLLTARWGQAVQAAVWNALLRIASDYAAQRNRAPLGISARQGRLRLHVGEPPSAVGLKGLDEDSKPSSPRHPKGPA